jgi:ABC-type multidrug transport system ATPase subunit
MSPTEGSITTRGRIVAMLNIGTGFHPELTGRENVYINAAILGMSPQEVDAIYDQIVEFAEIERFMHTPLKRYSSGMRVRLAFSVAIHVKPETIILDEVLAVGDPLFREKCLRAIEERFQNITVLIVSHNIQQLKRICDRIIWMQNGEILMMGDPDEVVSAYENLVDEAAQNQPGSAASASPLLLQQAQMLHPKTGAAVSILNSNVRGMIVLRYELSAPLERLRVTCNIWHRRSKVMVISTSDSDTTPRFLQPRMPGIYNASFQLPGNLLAVGHYVADVVFDDPQSKVVLGKCQSILRFQIVDHRSKRLQWLNEPKQSILNLDIDWQYQPPQDVVESDDSQEG